jgi:hypothetical protein
MLREARARDAVLGRAAGVDPVLDIAASTASTRMTETGNRDAATLRGSCGETPSRPSATMPA